MFNYLFIIYLFIFFCTKINCVATEGKKNRSVNFFYKSFFFFFPGEKNCKFRYILRGGKVICRHI
jgi:hypothetical protein